MNDERSLRSKALISLATVLVVVLVLYILIFKPFATEGPKFTAMFGQAGQGLGTSSPVKVRGMHVGRVSEIELLSNGRARITMTMDKGVKVPDTATASLEPESVFGPKFINLLLGAHETSGPFLKPGSKIENTADPRDLNDLLADANATLAALNPEDISVVVHTLAEGLGGQGQNLRETIDSVETIVEVAHDNRGNAKAFLNDLARLASIRGAGADIASIVADTNAIIDTAADGDGRLRAFAANISGVSSLVAHGFRSHGGDLREGFHSSERAVGVIHAQLGLMGDALRTGNNLLPVYKAVSWPAAPHDKRMLAVKVLLPANPCAILLGVCANPNSKPVKTTKKKGGRG
ncbi:MlaD family protein [Actinocorallia libanotica]|uniref:Phospholipid/cholesterol/gamma-HCH transport system substrate-binding protein n=1 Tax=Actinocorallia libanotica TaxID=46162 RepID=A0ABP4BZM9_9ACTN